MWTLAGEASTVSFNFTLEGQFVLPDEGSVFVTIRDNDGLAIQDWDRASQLDAKGTTHNVVVPAALNYVPVTMAFEVRYVRIEYSVGGVPRATTKSYRVTPFIPLQTSEEAVRARLGANEQEIPDSTIDLNMAYHMLLASGENNLPYALKANTAATLAANNAIEIKAALEQIPALAAKLAQMETQDNSSRVRMKLDIPQLRKELMQALYAELATMSNVLTGNTTAVGHTMLVVVVPTDTMTG